MPSPQLSLPDTEFSNKYTDLATTRHINHDVIGTSGLQDVSRFQVSSSLKDS